MAPGPTCTICHEQFVEEVRIANQADAVGVALYGRSVTMFGC